MKRKTRKSQGRTSPVRAAALGAALSLLALLLISGLGGLLVLKGILPEGSEGITAAAAVLLAAFLGPWPLLRAAGGKRPLPASFLQMGVLLAVLVLCKLIFWPGASFGNWPALIAAPVGASLCGLLAARKPKRRY